MGTLYMETTKIAPEKTAQVIVCLLAQAGATQVLTDYKDRELAGLSWTMEINGRTVPFSMPARVEPLFRLFQSRRKGYVYPEDLVNDRDKAKRVAWRHILRWVQAQLAMVETGMVQAEEVFMPYVQMAPGVTLYDQLAAGDFRALLPAPEQKENQ